MKKTYLKPQITFESFSLSTCIAGTCGIKTDLQSQYVCGLEFGDEMIFTSAISGCTTAVTDGSISVPGQNGSLNPICYHSPTETSRLFGS